MKELIPEIGRIVKKRQETRDVVSLWVDTDKKISFEPGQFLMVSLFGLEEAPISIAVKDGDSIILTVKGVGRLTNKLLSLPSNSEIGIRGPYGRGFPMDGINGNPIVLVAGGIGLPPIWSVIESLPTTANNVHLLYGIKTEDDIIYKERLNNLKGINTYLTVDRPTNGWRGHVGFVHQLLDLIDNSILKKALVFTCGPEVMYRPLLTTLEKKGVSSTQTYLSFERQMRCGIGKCWHCYQGTKLVCLHGPIFRGDEALREGFI